MKIARIARPPTVQDAPGVPEILVYEYQHTIDPRIARLRTIWEKWYNQEELINPQLP